MITILKEKHVLVCVCVCEPALFLGRETLGVCIRRWFQCALFLNEHAHAHIHMYARIGLRRYANGTKQRNGSSKRGSTHATRVCSRSAIAETIAYRSSSFSEAALLTAKRALFNYTARVCAPVADLPGEHAKLFNRFIDGPFAYLRSICRDKRVRNSRAMKASVAH